ncbi:CRISPR-associated helicase Cas3' [Nocardia jiangxiensis]|uniref:CRISPR-associated helicase Cas3' n=1 Tax=Nocardia jiangxiensis TaxID=282685 RepID=UPI001FE05DF5|nr:CRISPR-associated helicase Cas3' [Nocardia jiangxiensis]
MLGLFHDAGKAGCAWQEGLLRVEGTDNRVGVPHKSAGARMVSAVAGLAAMAISGHHGGMTDQQELTQLRQETDEETDGRFLFAVPEASAARLATWRRLFPNKLSSRDERLLFEMRLRMVFSALVDADHLDTAAHRHGLPGPQVAPPADMSVLAARFADSRARAIQSRRPDEVSELREEVYQAAINAAASKPGIFRLAAPTGLGKTYAQAGFGLEHAARWGKSRVIVAVPFITITEQNAEVYRSMLDTDDETVVLEHHSSVRFTEEGDGQGQQSNHESNRRQRLAAENWDAPFVITTTVQLFESLFGRKPSQIRKVHRLANSMIILDEVQALPHELVVPILSGLRTLTEPPFNATVLLTSATQPEFQALTVWKPSAKRDAVQITPVIPDPQPLFERARRVTYEWRLDPKPTFEQVASEVMTQGQALVVVNTIADARNLYRMLEHTGHVWHLSTRMCAKHRRTVLETVTSRLRDGEPTLLVSTQLVEAGVDLSFPTVWRALAPADSLQQAAGRSNRNGEFPDGGRVIVFDPADGHMPAGYTTACGLTVEHFSQAIAKLDDQQALARYYRALYRDLQLERTSHDKTKWPVGQKIQDNREKLDFRAVADGPLIDAGKSAKRDKREAFRMIREESVPLVIAANESEAQRIDPLLQAVSDGTITARTALRKLQPWTVQLGTQVAQRADVAASIDNVVGDLGRWCGTYNWNADTCQGVGLDEDALETIL